MKVVIDKRKYNTLKTLLAGSNEDKNLAVNIVDNCDIENSFLYVLSLMSQSRNLVVSYGSTLGYSKNLIEYLKTITEYSMDIDLEWILETFHKHKTPDNKEIKFLISEYQTKEINSQFKFKATLNPKLKKK